jgi:RNA polymerase sigma-54 factor
VQDFQNWEEYGYDDIPDYKTEYKNYLPEDKIPEKPLTDAPDFREDLKRQCRFTNIPEESYFLCDFLIDSVNEHGMLEQDLEELASELSFKQNVWIETACLEEALATIRQMDPPGIGSRNVQEYLLIQLRKMNIKRPDVKMAIRLLEEHYNDLRSRNIEKVKRELGLEEDEIKIVLQLLASLRTKPVSNLSSASQANQRILPDFIVSDEGDELEVDLYRQRSASLRINQSWMEMVQTTTQGVAIDKAARQYLRSKLSSAQWFINAIMQRESNMLKVMKAIVARQYEYFRYGDVLLLKPMKLKDIADEVKVDISTVSRITCNKYTETPFGTILLKDLFTEGIVNQEGDNISNRVIQTVIGELIQQENKKSPYTDRQLVTVLSDQGYNIARRTVAKYRELMNIPVAQIRGLWN